MVVKRAVISVVVGTVTIWVVVTAKGSVSVAFAKGKTMSRGERVAEVTVEKDVGKGATAGMPLVSRIEWTICKSHQNEHFRLERWISPRLLLKYPDRSE